MSYDDVLLFSADVDIVIVIDYSITIMTPYVMQYTYKEMTDEDIHIYSYIEYIAFLLFRLPPPPPLSNVLLFENAFQLILLENIFFKKRK